MTTHIALIRGINVGTAKRVAMGDLREMLSGLGYSDVRTLLNSGNAVLRSEDSPKVVAEAISRGLAGELKVPAEVIVRSRDQVVRAMDAELYLSCNRTCELGMTRATGHTYTHVLEELAARVGGLARV